MGGIDLSQGGVSITEGEDTVSLSRQEMGKCRHSQDVVKAIEEKLGRSLRQYYYFKYDAAADAWSCMSGDPGINTRPKEVIKEVPVVEYVERVVEKEKIVEVPVEKIVYVDKPVPYEKVVEKEVVKYVDKPVYIETPVDRIVEREKKIYVERVVEVDRPVDRVVEVPIEPTLTALWSKWKRQIQENWA